MPEAILKYKLPEEKDEFTLAQRGSDFYLTLLDFDTWLRSQIKYHDRDDLEPVRDKLYEIMQDRMITIDMVA